MTSCQRDASPSVTALSDASKKVRPSTIEKHALETFEPDSKKEIKPNKPAK